MLEEYEKRKRRQVSLMRSILDYGIGLLVVFMGVFLFFRSRFEIEFNDRFPPNEWDKVFGAVCVVYGLWRMYRGYKKNYFK